MPKENGLKRFGIGLSLYGLAAFVLQELPYLPWLLWPPQDNPLAGNEPANLPLGILEQAGGVLTIALLLLILRRDRVRPDFKSGLFWSALLCLLAYYVCWGCYFAGVTDPWLIVAGLSATVPLYYFFVAR